MTTDASSLNFLIKVRLFKTDVDVSRTLCVPAQLTFAELHEAIAAAFGWFTELCTSWVFKMVSTNPAYEDRHKQYTVLAAFWTAPDQQVDLTPTHHNTQKAIEWCMERVHEGYYLSYDYNIAKHPHFIEVLSSQAYYPGRKIMCLGGNGRISRISWQFPDLTGFGNVVAPRGARGFVTTGLEEKMEEVQKKYEERKRLEAEPDAAKTRKKIAKKERLEEKKKRLEAEADAAKSEEPAAPLEGEEVKEVDEN